MVLKVKTMTSKKRGKQVLDYLKFVRELKSQFNAVKALERQFFELEDLCEWSLKNDVTCLNDEGERVSVIDDCLGGQQEDVYNRLLKSVVDLGVMLSDGKECLEKKEV